MKTGVLITARLKSVRLPRKALRLIRGRPMIRHQIERLRCAERPDALVMCTSSVPEDDPLEKLADDEALDCFRGDPVDVLQRLTDAALQFDFDQVFVCTADNPFVDPLHLDRLVDFLAAGGYDYAQTMGLPWGAFGWAVTRPALERACELKATSDTEVWGGYFTQTGQFRCGVLPASPEVRWPELRLTVDTPKDFELVSKIFDHLGPGGDVFPLEAIVGLCRSRPELVAINADVRQKMPRPIRLRSDFEGAHAAHG